MENLPPIFFHGDSKEEAAWRACIRQDLLALLNLYYSRGQANFNSFKECWDQMDMSLMHVVRQEEISSAWFYSCLFNEALENIWAVEHILWRSGVVFLLYFLHQTQPVGSPQLPIPVSLRGWSALKDVFLEAQLKDLMDVAVVLDRLQSQRAFQRTSMTRLEMLEGYRQYQAQVLQERNPKEAMEALEVDLQRLKESIEQAHSGLPGNTQLDGIHSLESEYLDAKSRVTYAFADPQTLHLAKDHVTRDFSQALCDWERQSFNASVESAAEEKGKRRKRPSRAQSMVDSIRDNSLPRPSTAPPPSNHPISLMKATEDMPPLF